VKRFQGRAVRFFLLMGGLAAPLLPPYLAALVLAGMATIGLIGVKPQGRERWIALAASTIAVVALARQGWVDGQVDPPVEQLRGKASAAFAKLWADLDREAAAAAHSLASAQTDVQRFDALAALTRREAGWRGELERAWGGWDKGRRSILLLDPDGQAVAWAGEGLLHELAPQSYPREGRRAAASFGAATLLAIRPLGTEARPWRIVVGASYPTNQLPFRRAWRRHRWAVIGPEASLSASRGDRLDMPPGTPELAVRRRDPSDVRTPRPGFTSGARIAWAALGLSILALAVLRSSGRALPSATTAIEIAKKPVVPLALGGALALAAAVGADGAALVLLAGGLGIAALGLSPGSPESQLRRQSRRAAPGTMIARIAGPLAGAASLLLLVVVALLAQRFAGPIDLGASLLGSANATAWRIGFALATLGLLFAAGRFASEEPEQERWGWIAFGLALASGAVADFGGIAIPGLAAAGAAAARWAGPRGVRRGRELPKAGDTVGEGRHQAAALAGLVALSCLLAGGVVEVSYRARLRGAVATELPSRLAPPGPREVAALRRRIESGLGADDLDRLALSGPSGLEREDLAFALWRRSSLARRGALSALSVRPLDGSPGSVFSFGLPLTADHRLDRQSERWRALDLPPWRESLIEGQVPLAWGGKAWAIARFSFLPRPGFDLADERRLEEIDAGLLRGGPAAVPVAELPASVQFALYDANGKSQLSPWDSQPPLPATLRRVPVTIAPRVPTPSGTALAAVRRAGTGWSALYLPRLDTAAALERVGNAAVGVVLLFAGAALLALVVVLPRAAVRELLARTVRSYSRRLLLVYGVLLLLPLALLNAVLVRGVERRLADQQRAAGQAALASAQSLLAEVLGSLATGFSVETTLDDAQLSRIAGLVHHEVNLYWVAKVYASSKHELFTAGLLPERIPGDIYAPLALGGEGVSSRINRAASGAEYLEIYAPVRPPGGFEGAPRLFLSAPLLAQQEEAALEVARLRRRALLVTAALIALMIAVGSRLAKSFTHPIRELVAGTARIAAGAPTLGYAPAELELAALGRAIDDMARRIAEARDGLLREKQVVERMIENITSGVVSLDRSGRVLLHNRVAADLLGVAVGERLDRTLGASRLAPVRAFLRETKAGESARRTIRLAPPVSAAAKNAPADHPADGAGGEREWTILRVPVPGAGEPSELLVVEDATEELRAQRLLAWAEMARIIAHEIKNPLTPIRLSTEHLREVWQRDREHFEPVFERCTTNILAQVDELRQIALEFSTYSSIPRIDPAPADLVAAMGELIEGYRAAPPPGVEVVFEPRVKILRARVDARLLGRAVRNLLENAIRASTGGGRVTLRLEAEGSRARIAVLDEGPGVAPELLPRIFDPYFSTHDTGTGLGLPIARRIAEEHGGEIAARNRTEPGERRGLEVAITLPAES
jgi:signal transduction histidine kinase